MCWQPPCAGEAGAKIRGESDAQVPAASHAQKDLELRKLGLTAHHFNSCSPGPGLKSQVPGALDHWQSNGHRRDIS